MARDPASASKRIGLRDIARAARVCLMTVSLSLRDHPKISEPTRRRVRRIADQLGYRPDPEIARLIGRLRSSRTKRGSVVIAMVDLHQDAAAAVHPYDAEIRHGGREPERPRLNHIEPPGDFAGRIVTRDLGIGANIQDETLTPGISARDPRRGIASTARHRGHVQQGTPDPLVTERTEVEPEDTEETRHTKQHLPFSVTSMPPL